MLRVEANSALPAVAGPSFGDDRPGPPAPRTRLMPPRLGRGIVPRPRLAERLAAEEWPSLALVVAPAGFGKTVLLCQWCAAAPFPSAWLTADPDDDLPAFLGCLLAATSRAVPGARFPASRDALAAGQTSPDRLADALCDDLVDCSERLLLVVDDCDRIADPALLRFLARLLRHPAPGCTLALASRSELPVPIALVRARGGLVEVGPADLRFTDEEAGAVFAAAGLDPGAIAAAADLARGWAAGVRLLSAPCQPGADAATALVAGATRAAEFMLSEIVQPLSPDERRLLEFAGIAERTPLALIEHLAAAAGIGDAAFLLDRVCRATGLLARDDADPPAVRCHPLLRRAFDLDARLAGDRDRIRRTHAAASAWFAERRMVAEAVAQAFAASDPCGAARIVEDAACHAFADEDPATAAAWLALLPSPLVKSRPRLLLAAARLACLRGDLDGAEDGVEHAAALHARSAQPDAATLGEAQVVACAIRCRRGDFAGAVDAALSALTLLPADGAHRALRAAVMPDLVVAATLSGRGAEAEPLLATAPIAPGGGAGDLSLLLALGIAHALWGRPDEAEAELRRLLRRARGVCGCGAIRARGHLWLGRVCYQRNRLEEAAGCFDAALDLGGAGDSSIRREAATGVALTAMARGRRRDADRALATLAADASASAGDAVGRTPAGSLAARVALIDGDRAAAARWLAADETSGASTVSLESPCLTRVRVRLALGGRQQAERALRALREAADRPDVRFVRERAVEACALEVLAHEAAGDAEAADQAVVRLLALAEPGRFVRAILDAGPAILPVLARNPGRFGGGAFHTEVMDAACGSRTSRDAGDRWAADAVGPGGGLSHREREVLGGLARRLTDKEIAQELRISPLTVKRHASNLYAKLGASGRRDAVRKARDLGFAPDEHAGPLTGSAGLR